MMNNELEIDLKTHKYPLTSQYPNKPILLFDGVCNLCNGAVDFVIRHEKSSEIRFASIQSEASQSILKALGKDSSEMNTLYVVVNNSILEKSEAILFLSKFLKKPWSFVQIFKFLPTSFLNIIYDFISKNRYRFFGKRESCRLPDQSILDRFL
ncbi:MAG: DCC1-like thiol-disulfide oxidoreductase family protein [Bacteroidota bacterium]